MLEIGVFRNGASDLRNAKLQWLVVNDGSLAEVDERASAR